MKAGAVLVEVDPADYQAQYDQAAADVAKTGPIALLVSSIHSSVLSGGIG